jgi:hypothetical protein
VAQRMPSKGKSRLGIVVAGVVGLVLTIAAFPMSMADAAMQTAISHANSSGTLVVTLNDPQMNLDDAFGASAAISGNTAIVGAGDGFVYIYVKGKKWPATPTATLPDPANTGGKDHFGSLVAISGTVIALGAPLAGSPQSSGAVYVYLKGHTSWKTTPSFTYSDPLTTAGDYFGSNVAISGGTLVIGANGTNSGAGATYIYQEGSTGWPASPTTSIAPPVGLANDSFGRALAVSGTSVLVGAGSSDIAYMYVRGTKKWSKNPTITLVDPSGNGDFGQAVAVSGTTAVVGGSGGSNGTGASYVYIKGSSGWSTTPAATLVNPAGMNDQFGFDLAVSGATLMVAAPAYDSSAGVVYVYAESHGRWKRTPDATLSNPEEDPDDNFGDALAISEATAVVGGLGNVAYVYRL